MEDNLKDSNGVQYVRCLKCDKIIKCTRHDTTQLIEHIKRDHPEVTVVENNPENLAGGASAAGNLAGGGTCGGGFPERCPSFSNNANKGNCQCNCPSQKQKGHLFRTSIERWRPANGTIYCPFCCCKKQPLVKMRNERLSGNSVTANCMLACWPLCFLPFCLPGNDKEYLYCANCKCFLGLYDKANNCIRPNKQFSEKLRAACEEAQRQSKH